MTEQEWDRTDLPFQMLSVRRPRINTRTLRLLGCAICRRFLWHVLEGWRHAAVAVAEDYADGKATAEQMERAGEFPYTSYDVAEASEGAGAAAMLVTLVPWKYIHESDGLDSLRDTVEGVLFFAAMERSPGFRAGRDHADRPLADTIREVFGNPFDATVLDGKWVTPAAVSLADAMYEARAFDWMPALADELERAGCDDVGVLSHCRAGGEHARGCWVIDAVLGKS